MYRFIDGKPSSLYSAVSFRIATPSPVLYLDNLPGLLFLAFVPHVVNTFTRSISVRIMVNRKERVKI